MDELAVALDLDPLELRIRNHAEQDPTRGVPFSSKRLLDCYARGAERFGWAARYPEPRSMRDGHDLIGWGMASATMPSPRVASAARVTIDQHGDVLVETGTQEIGTGVRTILPQIAADALGVAPTRTRLVLGDTTLPTAFGSYGSSTTIGVGSAVLDAARTLRARLNELAPDASAEPRSYGQLLAEHGFERLCADGAWAPGGSPLGELEDVSIHTFGAVFAEVRIDEDLCIPRLTRMVGVYSAYLVPVNADVPELDASFIEDEVDEIASTLGAKGIGELGAVGAAPAIANAVYHATGVRIRELPIRPEMLLATTS
jgi:xanthine dehydrogenase YagR molybdenum-binding subunit